MRKFTSIVATALVMAVTGLALQDTARASRYSNAVLADGPVAYYRMNEASGATVAIDSISAQNGAYVGGVTLGNAGPQPASGFGGLETTNTGATLDGTSGYMDTGAAITTLSTTNYSFAIWFNRASNNNTRYIGGRYGTTFHGDSLFTADSLRYFDGVTAITGPVVTDSVWHQAVLTRNGTAVNVYLDGALAISTTAAANPYSGSNEFVVGRRADNFFYFSTGLDELSVYNSTLSASQVLTEYTAALPEPGSIAMLGIGAIGWLGSARRRNRGSI